MTFTEIASHMYQNWIAGFFLLLIIYFSSYRSFLTIKPKTVLKWALLIFTISFIKMFIMKHYYGDRFNEISSNISFLPWQVTLFVFWEDLVFTVPIAILQKIIGEDSIFKKSFIYLLLAVSMVSFAAGHLYQGLNAAMFLSLYIPFTFFKGKELGFGTIMLCHIAYGLITILNLNYFSR